MSYFERLLASGLVRQFMKYLLMGGLATAADWGSFFILNQVCGFYYRGSLVASFLAGSFSNFALNKRFTFHDQTRRLLAQLSIYGVLIIVSFTCSYLLMSLQVDLLLVHPMIARMCTTGIMLVANFALNKFVTFNRRLFSDWKPTSPKALAQRPSTSPRLPDRMTKRRVLSGAEHRLAAPFEGDE